MQEALTEARKSFEIGEVPVGAVLVYQNEIIARGHNQVEFLRDATAHAELLCLKHASTELSRWRLNETTLYSTLEPCAMCAGGMILARIKTLVWGAPDLRQGANGSLFNILDHPHPIHKIQVRQGILQSESSSLMKAFFRERRRCKKSLMN